MASIRERRQRRILERGSDRLALITGRTPTQSATSQDLDFAGFSLPSILDHQDFIPSVYDNEEVQPSNLSRAKSNPAAEFNHILNSVTDDIEEHLVHKAETDDISTTHHGFEVKPRSDSSGTVHDQPFRFLCVHQHPAMKMNLHDIFTYQRVTTTVTATEQIRMFCSLAVGFLVVLSYMGFPIVSSRLIGTIIRFRPLCIVLIANITMILIHLLVEEQECMERERNEAGKSRMADGGYTSWTKDEGKAIEMTFMAISVIGALFMDCTVYSIIIICGLSVA
ncbi:hypothetical protein Droror1_Dr00017223 [Drosera rotundifolia]